MALALSGESSSAWSVRYRRGSVEVHERRRRDPSLLALGCGALLVASAL
jgi:hypothetical protein